MEYFICFLFGSCIIFSVNCIELIVYNSCVDNCFIVWLYIELCLIGNRCEIGFEKFGYVIYVVCCIVVEWLGIG